MSVDNQDPFKNRIRKFIPLEVYWSLYEFHQNKSLCEKDLSTLSPTTIQNRIDELSREEKEKGFVFDDELRWLEDWQEESNIRTYGEWIHIVLEMEVFECAFVYQEKSVYRKASWVVDLKEAHCVGEYYNEEETRIFEKYPATVPEEFARSYRWLKRLHMIYVGGTAKEINKEHLVQIHRRISNLPYHYLENYSSFRISDGQYVFEDESAVYGIEVSESDLQKWGLHFENDASAYHFESFVDRVRQPTVSYEEGSAIDSQAINRCLAFFGEKAGDSVDPYLLSANGCFDLSTLQGKNLALWQLFKHREILKDIESEFFDNSLVQKLLSESCQFDTPCAILRDVQLDGQICCVCFFWGELSGFPEYKIGDSIEWGEHSHGEKAIESVILGGKIIAQANGAIVNRNAAIYVRENRIERVDWLDKENSVAVFGSPHHAYLGSAAISTFDNLDDFSVYVKRQ